MNVIASSNKSVVKPSLAILVFCVLILGSCNKEKNTIQPDEVFEVEKDVRLNDVEILSNGVWQVCGGNRDESGFFFRSLDNGSTWVTTQTDFPRSVYCLHFLDSLHGLAGGDFLDLWRTTDGGLNWYFEWLEDQVPTHEEDRSAIRNLVMQDDSIWFFCGGENLGEGVIYTTTDAGHNWNFRFYQNEFRALEQLPDGKILAGGHGKVIHSQDHFIHTYETEFKSDFMVSVKCLSDVLCVAVSNDGAIYRSMDGGLTWTDVNVRNRPFAKRENWNMITDDDQSLIVVGNRGKLARSVDDGQTWTYATLEGEPDLFSVYSGNGYILATSDRGRIYQFRWP